jgi:hypothetical protein
MITTGKVYLQVYNRGENKFEEFQEALGASGIYVIYNSGDIYSDVPSNKIYYSGLQIPFFKAEKIITYPVQIGQMVRSVGPGINIGEWNLADSPYSIRITGDCGEVIIGEKNYLISGSDNCNIGHRNYVTSTRLVYLYGRANFIENSNYIVGVGANNYVSGFYLSNIFGKNNNLYSENNIEDVKQGNPAIYSGYQSSRVTMIGDYNNAFSGSYFIHTIGDANYFAKVNNLINYGNYNYARLTSGNNNAIFGYRNDISYGIDDTSIGNENTLSNATGDFVVGLSNVTDQSFYNYIFGSHNAINQGSNSIILGKNNSAVGTSETILGFNNQIDINSTNDTIVGDANLLSGTSNSYIIGSNNTSSKTVLGNVYGIRVVNNEVVTLGPYAGSTGYAGNNNFFVGNGNQSFLNQKTFAFGESNKLIDNSSSYILGSSNNFINNNSSYVFGYNNSITGSRDSIFVGFNFSSGNGTISGVGIKITPSGLDIFGTLRVNGVKLNVP